MAVGGGGSGGGGGGGGGNVRNVDAIMSAVVGGSDATDGVGGAVLLLPSSLATGAAFRGLPADSVESTKGAFTYVNSLGHPYDDQELTVTSVTFYISRYATYDHTIAFDAPVTEAVAIEAVEAYLSEPITEEFYQQIKDDLFHQYEWKEAQKYFECRGDCLTDCRFLERTTVNMGNLKFFIGS
jgi:hypothetical protein